MPWCGCCGRSGGPDNTSTVQATPEDTTGTPRNKVALKPGHSLMDWIRLSHSGVDLTGVGGILREVTVRELAMHNSRTDAWLAIRGKVYNVTHYMDFHPGGEEQLMRGVGKDATELFSQVHAWVNYDSILHKCTVGRLVKHDTSSAPDLKFELYSNKSNKTSNQNTEESTSKEAVKDQIIRMDWYQKSSSICLEFYTKGGYPQICVSLLDSDKDFRVHIRLQGGYSHLMHIELEGEILWPCTVLTNYDSGKVEVQLAKKVIKMWQNIGRVCEDSGVLKAGEPRYSELEVVNLVPVTYNTKLIVLKYKNRIYHSIPVGYHIRVRCNILGEEVVRQYTPVAPALHKDYTPTDYDDNCICLMVKEYPNGTVSSWMCGLNIHDMVEVSEPEGYFNIRFLSKCMHLYLLAAGTGFTPMVSLLLWVLGSQKHNRPSVRLIFYNRTQRDILWREQLQRLEQDCEKFSVTHVLSDGESDWTGMRGKVSREMLDNLLPVQPDNFVCVCGPTAFTSSVIGFNMFKRCDKKIPPQTTLYIRLFLQSCSSVSSGTLHE